MVAKDPPLLALGKYRGRYVASNSALNKSHNACILTNRIANCLNVIRSQNRPSAGEMICPPIASGDELINVVVLQA